MRFGERLVKERDCGQQCLFRVSKSKPFDVALGDDLSFLLQYLPVLDRIIAEINTGQTDVEREAHRWRRIKFDVRPALPEKPRGVTLESWSFEEMSDEPARYQADCDCYGQIQHRIGTVPCTNFRFV